MQNNRRNRLAESFLSMYGPRWPGMLWESIYGALATSHKGKSRVDAEADFDRLFICIVGVECGVM